MSKKRFRRRRICKTALPDGTIFNVENEFSVRRSSRRRRYRETALPVVKISNDTIHLVGLKRSLTRRASPRTAKFRIFVRITTGGTPLNGEFHCLIHAFKSKQTQKKVVGDSLGTRRISDDAPKWLT